MASGSGAVEAAACEGCVRALKRAARTFGPVLCTTCETYWEAPRALPPLPAVEVPPAPAHPADDRSRPRPVRAPLPESPARVYRSPGDAPARPPRAPRPTAEDRELVRVRTLLYALRPDCADPLRPPPKAPTAAPVVRVRDPMAGWGDVPAALEHGPPRDPGGGAELAAKVLDRIRDLPEDARAVAGWLREYAILDKLRSLYVDVGMAFASDAQVAAWGSDLTARRDGSHHAGRTFVLATATAWGIPEHKSRGE